jgi:hypothetical protein
MIFQPPKHPTDVCLIRLCFGLLPFVFWLKRLVHLFLLPNSCKSATTSWGYEDGPWKGPGPPLRVSADFNNVANYI